MTNFIHRWLNPHCEHCAEERREAQHSEVVEILKMQLALKTDECDKLMDRLFNPPIQPVLENKPVEMTRPMSRVTWNMRKNMLETEDRERARLMNQAPKPTVEQSVEELEKELGVK